MEKKILFVGRSVYHFSYYSSLLQSLINSGATVKLLFDSSWSKNQPRMSLDDFILKNPDISIEFYSAEDLGLSKLNFAAREILSCISYSKRTKQSSFYLKRWINYIPTPVKFIFRKKSLRKGFLKLTLIHRILRLLSGYQVSNYALNQIQDFNPSIVIATPANLRFSTEVEYIRAANSLNIKTITPVLTWDNLTTKGLFHAKPSILLAWNNEHVNEAVSIHKIPENNIRIMGSLFFDKWLDQDLLLSRDNIYNFLGMSLKDDYILYLGSSANIAKDERSTIYKLVQYQYYYEYITGRRLKIVLKPHPANYHLISLICEDGIIHWPDSTNLPESRISQKLFYSAMYHAIDCVGINTSAMLDAICVKTTCSTLMRPEFSLTQEKCMHFKKLTANKCLKQFYDMKAYIHYCSLMGDPERRHSESPDISFIRPYINKSASSLMTDYIVDLLKHV